MLSSDDDSATGDGLGEGDVVHCSGVHTAATEAWWDVDYATTRAHSHGRWAADLGELYEYFYDTGLQYGPGYRTLVQAWSAERSRAVARLRIRTTGTRAHVHPADLDDALCILDLCGTGEDQAAENEAVLPFAVDVCMLQRANGVMWAAARMQAGRGATGHLGTLLQPEAQLDGFKSRVLRAGARTAVQKALSRDSYVTKWEAIMMQPSMTSAATAVHVCGPSASAASGGGLQRVGPSAISTVVVAIDQQRGDRESTALTALERVLTLTQVIAAAMKSSRLWVVTLGTQLTTRTPTQAGERTRCRHAC